MEVDSISLRRRKRSEGREAETEREGARDEETTFACKILRTFDSVELSELKDFRFSKMGRERRILRGTFFLFFLIPRRENDEREESTRLAN